MFLKSVIYGYVYLIKLQSFPTEECQVSNDWWLAEQMSTFIHAKEKGSDEWLPIWNCKEDDVESFWRKPRHRILLRLQKLIFCERGCRSDCSVAFILHQLLLRQCWIQILRKPIVFEFGIKFRGGNSQKAEHKTRNSRISTACKSNLAKLVPLFPFPFRDVTTFTCYTAWVRRRTERKGETGNILTFNILYFILTFNNQLQH
jgi:hypothetical protein